MSNEDNSKFCESCEKFKMQIAKIMVKNINKSCLLIENEAKKRCPVDNRALRAAMFHYVTIQGEQIVGKIGNKMEYAPYAHQNPAIYTVDGDGRKNPCKYKRRYNIKEQQPQPFLDKAKTSSIARIQNILGEGLK